MRHKPAPSLGSQGDATDDAAIGKVYDPFMPPYNTNLHVGDLKDEESQEEFVVLVRKTVLPKIFTDLFFFF